ncbi:hypothetical protein Efla_003740 [Eimeria flavescens]
MGRPAGEGAPRRGASQKEMRRKAGSGHPRGPPSGREGPLSLLELQLQALVRSSRCVPPTAGQVSGASGVVNGFVCFLEEFLTQTFKPVSIHLDGSDPADGASCRSQRAASLFSRVPSNTTSAEREWVAPRPARVEVVGSCCSARLGPPAFARNVDIVFELPEASLDTRDYLNYRYLAKRAAYLDAVHAQLQEAIAAATLEGSWEWAKLGKGGLQVTSAVVAWRFDESKPYVSLRFQSPADAAAAAPADADAAAAAAAGSEPETVCEHLLKQLRLWEVRLFPSCPSGVFKEKLLRPDANSVRRRTTATRGLSAAAAAAGPLPEAAVKKLPPTPYYNGLVLEDTRFTQHAKILRACAADVPGFADAVLLLKAWAKRRGLVTSGAPPLNPPTGLCGFTLSLLLAHVCLANAEVTRGAAPAQLFRLALTFLASADFATQYYCFGVAEGQPKKAVNAETAALLEAAVAARNDAADATAAAPAVGAAAAEEQQETGGSKLRGRGRRELCVGLVEEACLFDSPEKTFNVLWRAQLHMQELQHEARSSLSALQTMQDPFLLLFGEHQEQLLLKSDLWVRSPSLPPRGGAYAPETSVPVANYEAPALDQRHAGQDVYEEEPHADTPSHFDIPKWEAAPAFLAAATLGRLVLRGLSDRLQLMRLRFTPVEPAAGGALDAAAGSAADRCPVGVLLCVTLNGKASSRLLDRGPSVVDAAEAASRTPRAVAAESFRRFWGPRCDVRRFQDGRMLHCVLWEKFAAAEGPAALERASSNAAEGLTPPEQIVRAVLERHAAGLTSYTAFSTKTEQPSEGLAHAEKTSKKRFFTVSCCPVGANGPLPERQKALIRAFSALKNLLCSLSSVPLNIKQIWHCDAALRHTEVLQTSIWGTEAAEAATVHSVVVQFEDSGKWPVEREAVRRLKTAFLVAMNEELLRDYSIPSNVMESYLDVHFQSFIFRVQIFHPNEVMEEANIFTDFSLKPITSRLGKALNAGKTSSKDAATAPGSSVGEEKAVLQTCDLLLQEDVAILFSINAFHKDPVAQLRSLWWGPQVSAMLHSLALRHTAFAGAVRLATLWLSKQLIVGAVHFAEHVMAFLFVDHLLAGYGDEPQSPHVALLRFLHFVGSFDWDYSPLLVSFDSASHLTEDQRQQMRVSFEHFGRFPSVHSAIDPHGFILPLPEPASFQRLCRCARSCSQRVRAAAASMSRLPAVWRSLFCTDWRQFDIIIKLKDPLVDPATRPAEQRLEKKRKFANLAFNVKAEDSNVSLLRGLLQQESTTDITVQLAKPLHLSSTAPEAPAVLDDLLLRAFGSKACVRRYLLLRFLNRLCRAFPDALVVGFDFVQAQQLGGGLPSAVALKIPPAMLLCKALQPSSASPSLLLRPSWSTHSEMASQGTRAHQGLPSVEEGGLIAALSPSLLLGGITSIGSGMIQEVALA